MLNLLLSVLVVLFLAAAAYAHHRMTLTLPSARHLRTARIVLIATGLGFGWVMARLYGILTELNVVLVFLASFGVIHVPAAAILFTKSWSVDE